MRWQSRRFFTVGSTVRHPPDKSDAANKARLFQFEALHKRSLDSQMQVDDGAEDWKEEVATEDPAVEQEEEHDEASVWKPNDSSSASPGGQHGTEEEVHLKSPSSEVSTRSQASVQLSAPHSATLWLKASRLKALSNNLLS